MKRIELDCWYVNQILIGISWGTTYERKFYICLDLPFVDVQIRFKR